MKVWYNDNNYCDAYAPCTQKGRIHDKSKKKHALYRLSADSFHAGSCFLSAGFGGQCIIEHIHDSGHEHDRHNPRGRDGAFRRYPGGRCRVEQGRHFGRERDGTTAEIVAANGDTIAVAAKSSDYANSVFNLNNLDEKGKKDFLKYMEPSSMDGSTTGTITWYDHAQIPFFMIDICAENIKEEGPVYERLYGTLYDGKIVSFDLFGDTKEISEETDAFMRAVVDSAVISAFAEAPTIENGLSRQSAVTLGAVGVLIVLLIVYFVTTHSRNKREKQLRKETADRLAEYRRSKQDDESVGTGALRFVNETDHDDAAIKTFANYQAYHLQIFMPVFTVVLSVIALYVVWQLGNFDSNWWVMLLLIGFAIYSLYKLATASTNTAKVLMRSYGKLRNRRAAYYFYDGDFRITGLQASNLHPYFQISRMYETNEYFYMYFGEGNTYFIRKDGFKQGDADAFRTFMKEKLGKRFK